MLRHILLAVLILMIVKGFMYFFLADHIKYLAQKMADIDPLQYKIFGLLLFFMSFILWVGWLRYMF
ncbi:MAG: hypothetical protein IJY92_00715 [Alphaproteobacteria bacterium]|nr:hypothetical protein [Alphaproteobacteria bacterium]